MAEEYDYIYNAENLVAIRYYQTIPHTIGVGGEEFAFIVQHNICMGWIPPEKVDQVLAIKKNCCGNNRKSVYFVATQYHVDIWSGVRVR